MTSLTKFRHYFANCFLLILPILVWNIALQSKLPEVFQQETGWQNSAFLLTAGEAISRIIVFALTLLMPLRISTGKQRAGLCLYSGGVALYFISWLPLIYFPDGKWSSSLAGFSGPAYTPLLWLTGIGLLGDSFYFNLPFKRSYFFSSSIVFLLFHNVHTIMIYYRMH
jgi:hypothetical protein